MIRQQVPEVLGVFQAPDFEFALQSAIAAYLAEHRDRVRPVNLELAAKILMTAVEAIAEACATDSGLDARSAVAETSDLVARYLLRDV